MDSLKTLHSELVKPTEQSQLLGEPGNKDLWLRALEKNGLYSSLNKFEVLVDKHMPEGGFDKQSASSLVEQKRNVEQFPTIANKNVLSVGGLNVGTTTRLQPVAVNVNGGAKIATLNQAVSNYQQLNVLFVTDNKGIRLAALPKDNVMNMHWLSRNTTITMASSGVEVWVRDSSLADGKLSNVLKHLRHSMADLGASLSKVTINGKIAYQANHHSRMEG